MPIVIRNNEQEEEKEGKCRTKEQIHCCSSAQKRCYKELESLLFLSGMDGPEPSHAVRQGGVRWEEGVWGEEEGDKEWMLAKCGDTEIKK